MATTRSVLVQHLAALTDITTGDAEKALNAVLDTISNALEEGDRVELRGFGGFSVREREVREARNPRTGATVRVAARRVLHFKAGGPLLKALNGDPETLNGFQEKRKQQCRRRDERSGELQLF